MDSWGKKVEVTTSKVQSKTRSVWSRPNWQALCYLLTIEFVSDMRLNILYLHWEERKTTNSRTRTVDIIRTNSGKCHKLEATRCYNSHRITKRWSWPVVNQECYCSNLAFHQSRSDAILLYDNMLLLGEPEPFGYEDHNMWKPHNMSIPCSSNVCVTWTSARWLCRVILLWILSTTGNVQVARVKKGSSSKKKGALVNIMVKDKNEGTVDEDYVRNVKTAIVWVELICYFFVVSVCWEPVLTRNKPCSHLIAARRVKASHFLYIFLFLLVESWTVHRSSGGQQVWEHRFLLLWAITQLQVTREDLAAASARPSNGYGFPLWCRHLSLRETSGSLIRYASLGDRTRSSCGAVVGHVFEIMENSNNSLVWPRSWPVVLTSRLGLKSCAWCRSLLIRLVSNEVLLARIGAHKIVELCCILRESVQE